MTVVNAAVIDGFTNVLLDPSHSTSIRFPDEVYSQVFEGLDVNEDGKIELGEVQQDAGTLAVEAMIRKCDQDGDALLDIYEFPKFLDMALLPKK